MKKIAVMLAFLTLGACDVIQQVAEDQIRNEVSERVDAAENEIRARADEHLNTVAPELSNRIDDAQNQIEDAQNSIATAQQRQQELEDRAGR